MDKVLLIEDDMMIGEMLAMYLSEEGFEVKRVENGTEGLTEIEAYQPDLILLDLVLPDVDGFELCAQIRSMTRQPMMIVSMRSEVSERVKAFALGADDYISKPFSMRELTARAAALIRRSRMAGGAGIPIAGAETAATLESGEPLAIKLDPLRRLMSVGNQTVETTYSEFEIMRLFVEHAGKVFSREELIQAVRGFDSYVTDRAIDVHIVNLRRKIERDPKEPRHIKTVWGVGYKFER
ncbi:MAG: response regulator transcription factor [Paenibacillaceae bacterium]|nr:response regulator transcription factor [Paenibacillaceae bacterium]